MKSQWANINASLLRFCADFRDDMEKLGFNLEVVNLDDFTEEEQWPDGDFVGISNVMVDVFETYDVKLMFALSTKGDLNFFRLGKLTTHLLDRLLPNSSFNVLDADSGVVLGNFFVLNGTRVSPPVDTKTQPVRPIMVSLKTDLPSF